jgi:soluble lytic murein transglycosylase-like protein
VDSNRRHVYVNREDKELLQAVAHGGAPAVLRVMDARQRALPGIHEIIEEVCREQRVDPRLVRALIEVESGWNLRARSRKGAMGLMQLMPETAARMGVRHPYDAQQNVRGGVRYLRWLLDLFQGNQRLALAAFNAGEQVVQRHGAVPAIPETQAYVKRILQIYGGSAAMADPRTIVRTEEDGRVLFSNY